MPYPSCNAEPGNLLAASHGAYVDRLVNPRAEVIHEAVLVLARASGSPIAYLSDPSYEPAIRAWARVEARLERVDRYVEEHGDFDAKGRERPASKLLERLEARAESLRARLGFDPLARARLGRDVASGSVDLARLFASMDDEGAVRG